MVEGTETFSTHWKRIEQDTIEDFDESPPRVTFDEEVYVYEVARKHEDDIPLLFWSCDDYERMRNEDQINCARRARARKREAKRRVVASASSMGLKDGDKKGIEKSERRSLEGCKGSDSIRMALDRLKIQKAFGAHAA